MKTKEAQLRNEIQRLTKEVEELKGKAYNSDIQAQNTRLRELLRRAEPQLNNFVIEMLPVEMESTKQLLKDIDNELNPKYNPPYIEGTTDLQNEG